VSQEWLTLEPVAEAPRLARAALRSWLAREGLEALEERALLVVSELVANAVVHAGTVLELSFSAGDRSVEVGVSDQDCRAPRLVRQLGDATELEGSMPVGGWGLAIVAELADNWGVTEMGRGKRVWARWLGPTDSGRRNSCDRL
jgi:anti-sigma regulatory factor (Ser/Thr protein kinase)